MRAEPARQHHDGDASGRRHAQASDDRDNDVASASSGAAPLSIGFGDERAVDGAGRQRSSPPHRRC
jgi:hypothetical protein